jgi:hypothetical protein
MDPKKKGKGKRKKPKFGSVDDLLARDLGDETIGTGTTDPVLDLDIFEGLDRESEIIATHNAELQSLEIQKAMDKQNALAQGLLKEEQIRLEHAERVKQIEEKAANDRIRIMSSTTSEAGKSMGKLAALQNTNNKKGFEASKRLRIAEAAIGAPSTVMKAYERGVEVPVVGMVLGPLYAGIAAAFVAAQIAQIKKQKFGGGGSTASSSVSVSAPSGPFGGGLSAPQQGGDTIQNNIIVDGNVIHQSLLDVNDAKSQQGQRALLVTE